MEGGIQRDVEEEMDQKEIKLGMKFTLFRVMISSVVSIMPFLECLPDSSDDSTHLLAGDSFNRGDFWYTDCSNMEPYMLVLIVWVLRYAFLSFSRSLFLCFCLFCLLFAPLTDTIFLYFSLQPRLLVNFQSASSSVFNVISFQLESHLREKVHNETVEIDFEAESKALAKSWPTLARFKSDISDATEASRTGSGTEMSDASGPQSAESVQA